MSLRLSGLGYAIGVGIGLYYFWPDIRALLGGTWLADLWILVLLVYALGGMWIAERIWAMIPPLFEKKRS